jgi:hypothetical protein
VWKSRDVRVEPDTAFTEKLEQPRISDEEWRQMEIERRKLVRRKLGLESDQPTQ